MVCLFFLVYFNKTSILSSKYTHDDIERHRFSRGFFLHFLSVFSPFSTEVWHLWLQKNNIAVGVRAPMRTYACTRETFPKKFSLHVFPHFLFFLLLLCLFLFPPSPSLSLLVFCASTTRKSVFCYVRIADLSLSKEENAHFLDFFTLWGNIDPYTNRGMRCTPPYLFRN